MKYDDKSKQIIFNFIQKKINLPDFEQCEIRQLIDVADKLEFLGFKNQGFFSYFLEQNHSVKVKVYSKEEADNVYKSTKFYDVIGVFENGWILGAREVYFYFGNEHDFSMSFESLANAEWFRVNKIFNASCGFINYRGLHIGIGCELMEAYKNFFIEMHKTNTDWDYVVADVIGRIRNEISTRKELNLVSSKNGYLSNLDKDSDGNVDLIENDFNKLLSINQKKIMDVDKIYIHKFVKVSNFIKSKRENTQKIFETIRDTSSEDELEERVCLLKNQIHSYELLVFHSINMLGSLVCDDLITFYEIYESFDKLGIFNSNWENEVSDKLKNIENKLDDLMYSIYSLEQNIVNELSHLTYVTQNSFEQLNQSVVTQLRGIESSINTNNLLAGIQTYQLYRINSNTRRVK